MKKLLKYLLWSIITLIIIVILGFLALIFLVNPNDYKQKISDSFYHATGRNLHLAGKLSWTLYPNIGINIANASIDNPTGLAQQNFATIKKMQLQVDLLPLLSSHIIVKQLSIAGLTLNLLKSSATVNNWRFSKKVNAPAKKIVPAKKTALVSKESKKTSLPETINLKIKRIAITDARINYANLSTKSAFSFTIVNATASNIALGRAFPLKAAMIFSGKTLLHPIKLGLNASITLPTTLNGISIKPLTMSVDKSTINGNVLLKNIESTPEINLSFKANRVDISDYVDLKGAHLPINNINVKLNLNADAKTDNFVKTLNGEVSLNSGLATLQGISIENILKKKNQALAGVKGKKMDFANILSMLKGGFLQGAKPGARINPNNGQTTSMPSITLNAKILNGVVHNNQLLIANKHLFIEGQGTIDLTQKSRLNYALAVGGYTYHVQQGKTVRQKDPVPIPFIITGTREHPKYAINAKRLAADAEKFIVKHVKQSIIQNIREKGKTLLKRLFKR